LTVEEIAPHYDIFMNSLYFLVDKDVAKDPLFDTQKKKGFAYKHLKSKKYTAADFGALILAKASPT